MFASIPEIIAAADKHCCAFCGVKEGTGKKFSLDHDHKTGKLRGLLCPKHNNMLQDISELKALIAWAESK
jgi:hypothetical protein